MEPTKPKIFAFRPLQKQLGSPEGRLLKSHVNNDVRLLWTHTKGLCTTDVFTSICLTRLAFPPKREFLLTFLTPIHHPLDHFSPLLLIGMFPHHQWDNGLPPSAKSRVHVQQYQDWESLFLWKNFWSGVKDLCAVLFTVSQRLPSFPKSLSLSADF